MKLIFSTTYLINSKISGRSVSRPFILSFMAMIIVLALSSAPCFELFSAAPGNKNLKNCNLNQNCSIITPNAKDSEIIKKVRRVWVNQLKNQNIFH